MPEQASSATADTQAGTQDGKTGQQPATADLLYGKTGDAPKADAGKPADAAAPAATEGQGQGDKATEGTEGAPKGDESTPGAAGDEIKLNVPEGFELTPELQGELIGIVNDDKGTPQERAQKLVDLHARLVNEAQTAQQEFWQKQQDTWVSELKADKEIGGADFTKNLAVATKAVKQFGGETLVKFLNETGLGNHPELVRAFVKIGRSISEAPVVTGAASGKEPRAADLLYGTQK